MTRQPTGVVSCNCTTRAPRNYGQWLDRVAVRGKVVVQFWLKLGEAAVTLGSETETHEGRIPRRLRGLL